MGYDMQWQKDGSNEGYFRANIWGMGELRHLMNRAGILDTTTAPPPWPEDGKDEELDDDERYEKWKKDTIPVRGYRSPDPGMVPIMKFGSNDAWIVTPEEARIIADGLEEYLQVAKTVPQYPKDLKHGPKEEPIDDDTMAFFKEFVAYNRKCADLGIAYEVC